MAHQTLRMYWFGNIWLTQRYRHMRVRGSPIVTYAKFCVHTAHQPSQIHDLKIHGSPNVTYAIVFVHMAHQTIQIQWFEGPRLTKTLCIQWLWDAWLTKPYKFIGFIANGSPSVTCTIVWGRIVNETIQIHYFEDPWLTQRYISKGLRHMAHKTPQIQLFSLFHRFHTFYVVSMFSRFSMLSRFLNVFHVFTFSINRVS